MRSNGKSLSMLGGVCGRASVAAPLSFGQGADADVREAETPRSTVPTHVFSIDVEDWFHILDLEDGPATDTWSQLPSRVELNLQRLLDLLSTHGACATLFFLGWIAERFPHLVREARSRGHEIASHGYSHRLVTTLSPGDFAQDTRRARGILQDISGDPIPGYRAPGFSVTPAEIPWFFECLAEAGHTYDCSVFPGRHWYGGLGVTQTAPHIAFRRPDRGLVLAELPMSVSPVLGWPICFFGGGYLRLSPTWLIKTMAERVCASGKPVLVYIHPRDIDPAQPRLPMPATRRFRSYVNLGATYAKLDDLLGTFSFVSVQEYLEAASLMPETKEQALRSLPDEAATAELGCG